METTDNNRTDEIINTVEPDETVTDSDKKGLDILLIAAIVLIAVATVVAVLFLMK